MPRSGDLTSRLTWATPPDAGTDQAWGPPSPSAALVPPQALLASLVCPTSTLALRYTIRGMSRGLCTGQPFSTLSPPGVKTLGGGATGSRSELGTLFFDVQDASFRGLDCGPRSWRCRQMEYLSFKGMNEHMGLPGPSARRPRPGSTPSQCGSHLSAPPPSTPSRARPRRGAAQSVHSRTPNTQQASGPFLLLLPVISLPDPWAPVIQGASTWRFSLFPVTTSALA